MTKSIHEKLEILQQEFKAPKTEYNSHGGFKYRTLEKMLEALKPLLKLHRVGLYFSDKAVDVGGRPHIEVTITIINLEDAQDRLTVTAVAQEADIQKGMQMAQISGSTSSYARKYALAGALLVDDSDVIDKNEGDQTDWDAEIAKAASVEKLMQIFNRMSSAQKKAFTATLSERKNALKEVENA